MTALELDEGVMDVLRAMAVAFGLDGPAAVLEMATHDWHAQFVRDLRIASEFPAESVDLIP